MTVKTNLSIATWVFAGLLIVTLLLLVFVPLGKVIDYEDRSVSATIFQHPITMGPTNALAYAALYLIGMPPNGGWVIYGFVNAVFYLVGTMTLLIIAQVLPLRYGLPIAAFLFTMFTSLTTVWIWGVVAGWINLPAWCLLATGTIFSGGFFWLKLVDFLRGKTWGQRLPLRYGLPIAAFLFAMFTYMTTICIIYGGEMVSTWSLLLIGTLLSGGFLWLRLVELCRCKK